MPRNIVICCDGTGNAYSDHNTNVIKLYQTLHIDGVQQVGYYHPGVGTEGSPTAHNKLESAWSMAIGLAFGGGLLRYVGDAYRFLMNTYQEGDHIFLFGFSRGAYTARSIAGILHMYGLLCPGNEGLIPYIIRSYARQTRNAAGMQSTFATAEGFKATFCRPCRIHLVGVWDTVSSVGFLWDPLKLAYTGRNPAMTHGRHAVSIDERRCFFRNNLWGEPFPGQTIKQVWFPGVHSDVGGSYHEAGLSQIALEWMLCEAVSLGLLVDREKAAWVLGRGEPFPNPDAPNPATPIHVSLKGFWKLLEFIPQTQFNPNTHTTVFKPPMDTPRIIPSGSVFHASVRQKLAVDPTYRPANLPPDWQQHEEPANPCAFPDLPTPHPS